ncbi:tail fiber domain-containing protein [Flavobacterium stagni]|uniref:Peptidase S74 domain-containing protein n=1 Tax=Flavobacterium stagni TaxID=2506421 RepID=A0A4Q1K3V2_9FLAO|nr:tail fiber domain-containing protein [Flavobacterium stagni]RXR20202.1 hypothetical protein EQG61_13205 [Flavobacterium stagni]
MKRIYVLVFFFVLQIVPAQVGVNTTDPKAQLDIVPSNATTPANTDGILIPRITTFPAVNPTAAQNGMLVYLSTASGSFSPGFYYWDNAATVWQPIAGTKVGTLDQAYDFGGAGLGKTITADAGALTINGTDGLISTGVYSSGTNLANATGVRMFWYPKKIAFRAGITDTDQWDNINVGDNSTAFGYNSIASGFNTFAFGQGTTASGNSATAFGSFTTASGNTSTAFGASTTASGLLSTAFGAGSTASGSRSFAFGLQNTASADSSTAFGQMSTASGYAATAWGIQNTAFSAGETVIGIGATTYTPTPVGNLSYNTTNATDRLFTIGNALDTNSNSIIDTAERSDAMVVLKNGNTGLGTATPATRLHVVGNLRLVDGNQAAGKVLTSDGNGTATWQSATSLAWGLSGNAGTNATTNFIGTTDNVDLVFKRNNTLAGLLGSSNTFFGLSAGTNSTGTSNTYIGNLAGNANTSGDYNTFLGRFSGANGSLGNASTYLGYAAGLNSSGNNNIAIGAFSGQNTSGRLNLFIGFSAGNVNTTGERNTLLGNDAEVGTSNLTNATALGNQAFVNTSNALVLGSINGVNGATASTSVGIGTTSPSRRLHVAETTTSTSNGQLYLEQQGTGDAFIQLGNTGTRHFSFGMDNLTDSFKLGTSPTTAAGVTTGTLMTVLATGEVGVGTTTPSRQFHIAENTASTTNGQLYIEQQGTGDAIIHLGNTGARHYSFGLDNITDSFKLGTSPTTAEGVTTGTLMTVLATGEVGVGTTTPSRQFHIAENSASTTNGQLYIEQQGTGDAIIHLGNTGARHYSFGLDTSADSFKIGTSATTATALTTGTLMTLLPTGEVGIGTTLPTEKLQVSGPAGLTVTRIANTSTVGTTSNVALDFFRSSAANTDWRIYNIGPNLTLGSSGDDLTTVNDLYQFLGARFMPMNDGTQSLGQAANRWNTLFATNGTINTSDRREKQDIQPLTYGLNQLMQLKPVTFKWKNQNIDNHSVHLGFIAQDLQEVVPEVVVDSQWSNASEGAPRVWEKAPLLGVNYAEVIPVLVKSIQEQQALINKQNELLQLLQQRIEQLENK